MYIRLNLKAVKLTVVTLFKCYVVIFYYINNNPITIIVKFLLLFYCQQINLLLRNINIFRCTNNFFA